MPDKIYSRLQTALAGIGADQREIAVKTGYTQGRVSQFLNGKAPLNVRFLKSFCQAFGIDECWLLYGLGEMTPVDHLQIVRELSGLSQSEWLQVQGLLHKLRQDKLQDDA